MPEKYFPKDFGEGIDFDLSKINIVEGILPPLGRLKTESFEIAYDYEGILKEICEALYRSLTGRELTDLADIRLVDSREIERLFERGTHQYGEIIDSRTVLGLQVGPNIYIKRRGAMTVEYVTTIMHEVGGVMVPCNIVRMKIEGNGLMDVNTSNIVDQYYHELAQMAFMIAADKKMATEVSSMGGTYQIEDYGRMGTKLHLKSFNEAMKLIEEGITPMQKYPEKYGKPLIQFNLSH